MGIDFKVVRFKNRFYIEYTYVPYVDDSQRARWMTFLRKRAPDKDQHGRFFLSNAAAEKAIQDFVDRETR